jgi:hypothetical protein
MRKKHGGFPNQKTVLYAHISYEVVFGWVCLGQPTPKPDFGLSEKLVLLNLLVKHG